MPKSGGAIFPPWDMSRAGTCLGPGHVPELDGIEAQSDLVPILGVYSYMRATTLPTIVESFSWIHRTTGQRVSPFGACPWVREQDAKDWELLSTGYAFQSKDGTVCSPGGRHCATRADAEEALASYRSYLEEAGFTVA